MRSQDGKNEAMILNRNVIYSSLSNFSDGAFNNLLTENNNSMELYTIRAMMLLIDVNVWEFRYLLLLRATIVVGKRGIEVDYTGDIFDIDKIPWFPQGSQGVKNHISRGRSYLRGEKEGEY